MSSDDETIIFTKTRKLNKKGKEVLYTPDPEWADLYQKINYKGNPLNDKIQERIHHIYNSLTPEQQDEWLERTKGLGWSDEYIQIALTYYDLQGEYHNRDEEEVNEYLATLTDEERSNFEDVCNVFSPDKPYIHIKDSCGFLEWKEKKLKKD